jgi:2-desacetyl-2-hydroxyethyl bacteriochlorophyllide A dehydrogenase
MKALFFDGRLELREVEKPRPAPGEALIQVLLAGICGTDREILKGYSNFRGIPGHEFVGRVVECEDARLVGKRVVGEINIACGECDLCLWGLGRHCPKRTVLGIVNRDGVFAEFVTLPVVNLHEVPKTVSDEAAVFVEPLAAAAEILEQMQVPPAAHVAVIGDGRLGLLVAQVLHDTQANVTVIGKHAWKLDLARDWGMKVASFDDEGIPARSFSVVVEATGSPAGLDQAFRLVTPRGTVVMKSTFHGQAHVDTAKLVVDEITLLGSRCGDFRRALELLARGRVKVQPLVSKTFPLEAGLEAFEYLNSASCLKVLLAPKPPKSANH